MSRWISADPLLSTEEYLPVPPTNDEAKKHNSNLPGMGGVFKSVNLNGYQYAGLNPVKFVDADGNEVSMVLNRDTNKLIITDLDTNDTIVVEAFTGGHSHPEEGITSPGEGKEISAPNGKYIITDNPNPTEGHADWFGVLKNDKRTDDYTKDSGKKRSGFRFHLGGVSWGCVTVNRFQDKAQEKWGKIQTMLKNTKSTKIDFIQGPHFWNKKDTITKYGELEIIGGEGN